MSGKAAGAVRFLQVGEGGRFARRHTVRPEVEGRHAILAGRNPEGLLGGSACALLAEKGALDLAARQVDITNLQRMGTAFVETFPGREGEAERSGQRPGGRTVEVAQQVLDAMAKEGKVRREETAVPQATKALSQIVCGRLLDRKFLLPAYSAIPVEGEREEGGTEQGFSSKVIGLSMEEADHALSLLAHGQVSLFDYMWASLLASPDRLSPTLRLDGLDFSGWNFSAARLSHVSAVGTVWRGADLREATLDNFDGRGGDFSEAQLDAVVVARSVFVGATGAEALIAAQRAK